MISEYFKRCFRFINIASEIYEKNLILALKYVLFLEKLQGYLYKP